MLRKLGLALALLLLVACNTGGLEDDINAVIDTIDDPDRKPIDTNTMGVNAFVNDGRFGSISGQFREVRDTLRLQYVRVLFNWNDQVQPSADSVPDFSFYDEIADGLAEGLDALVILNGLPSWMYDPKNWIDGNPRTTFVRLWVEPVLRRYGNVRAISSFQIWNEPNMDSDPDNVVLAINNSAANYVEMLALSYSLTKELAPGKLVVGAGTTAINQDFPDPIDYNEGMRDAGALNFLDVWAVHYYGKQYENVLRNHGVEEFVEALPKAVWVTETGEQGYNRQLEYVERTWPFLEDEIPNIQRFYYYQFTEVAEPSKTYGLRTLDQTTPLSDLYAFLRDRL